jgi:NADH dehydrogenase FAD-containing subunit
MNDFDVIIIGAGYGGLMCAVRLAGRTRRRLRIAVVNRSPVFVERLRLHEGLAEHDRRPAARLPPLRSFLAASGCSFFEGEVTGFARREREVVLATISGETRLRYRYLVVALGSCVDRTVPDASDHAFVLDPSGTRNHADLAERLAALRDKATAFVIAGGGATGIEAAAELALLPKSSVTIVEAGRFAAFATPSVRRALAAAVSRAGIGIVENQHIVSIGADHVATTDLRFSCDLCVWCGGFRGQDIVACSGLAADERGRILVDPYLRALSDPLIFAVGDACRPVEWHGAPPRMSAFFALTTGAHVADTIARIHADKQARPFGFWTWGQAIAVGREAVGFASIPYDHPIGPIYRGRLAFRLRWFFVWLLVRLIAITPSFPALPFWLGRGAYRRKDAAKYMRPLRGLDSVHDGSTPG